MLLQPQIWACVKLNANLSVALSVTCSVSLSGRWPPASAPWEGGRPHLQPSVRGHTLRGGSAAPHQVKLQGNPTLLVFFFIYTIPIVGFHQVGSRGIEAAWAGGVRGREVTDKLLPAVAQLLSSRGLFYLVTIAENDPRESLSP